MTKKVLRVGLLTSPIIALYGVAPLSLISKIDITHALKLWFALTVLVLAFWYINVLVNSIFKKQNLRYIFSYVFTILSQFGFAYIGMSLGVNHKALSISYLYPYLSTFAINTIILVIFNMISLKQDKDTAENEIQSLKMTNLEAQKHMLMQQLQPHFLFNSLSVLKSLIVDNQSNAEIYTQKLSDFLRYSVSSNSQDLAILEDELEFTEDYVELQKMRFGSAIVFERDIDPTYFVKKVPVFGVQTLVENAIKHNSFTEKKPLHIYLSIEKDRLKVTNNKNPKKLVLGSGTGLKNLNERYKLINSKAIEIRDIEEEYTVLIELI
ncbi:MAG: sensor histidine kinase [Leadbetterella sp.]